MTLLSAVKSRKYDVNSVVDAFNLIDTILAAKDGLGLAQLCHHMHITKNKAFRLLATLEGRGIVNKDQRSHYCIGIATVGIARRILAKESVLDNVRPELELLAKSFNEAVYYAHYSDGKAMLVDYVDCTHIIKASSFVGKTLQPLGSTKLDSKGNSVTRIGDITVDLGGLDPNITTVSVPFVNYKGAETGALVVLSPTFRMSLDRIKTEIVPALRDVMQQQPSLIPEIENDLFTLCVHPVGRPYGELSVLGAGVHHKTDTSVHNISKIYK